MSSLRDGFSTPYRLTKEHCLTFTTCPFPQWRPAFGPSCTEFVYPGCQHFDYGATSKIDDVLIEHVLPLAVHLSTLCIFQPTMANQKSPLPV